MARFNNKTWAAVMNHEDTDLAPPATPDAIAAFEAKHSLVLPPSHREFLLRHNGGIVGYVRLFGVGRTDFLDLAHKVAEMRPYIQATADSPVMPFASDWGGSYYCYDLARMVVSGEYPVLFWNHEHSEEPDDRPMLWSVFAPNFVAFIKQVIT
jgi:hypothetical protein